jgi:hypothetical protein
MDIMTFEYQKMSFQIIINFKILAIFGGCYPWSIHQFWIWEFYIQLKLNNIKFTKKENITKQVHINNKSISKGKIRDKIPLLIILISSTIVTNISSFINLNALITESWWAIHILCLVHSKDVYSAQQINPWVVPLGMSHLKFLWPIQL